MKLPHSVKENAEIISKIEMEFPVNKLSYEGIKIWPLIRWMHVYKKPISSKVNKEKLKRSINPIRKKILGGLNFFYNVYLHPIKAKIIDKQGNSSISSKESDILAITKSADRNEYVEGKHFCRFIDSLFYFTTCSKKTLEFSFVRSFNMPRYYPSSIISSKLANAFLKSIILNHFNFSKIEIDYLDEYIQYLKKIGFNIDKKYIRWQLYKIVCYKKVFDEIINRISPKLVLFPCYYTPAMFGCILSCNKLKIPTLEVQHGIQGDYHLMYALWNKIPEEGYDLLPTHFWMWGEGSARRVRLWAKKTERHEVIVGGNPWLAYYKENDIYVDKETKLAFESTIGNKKYKILVAMQHIDDFKKSCIVKAIQETGNDFIWLLRMHPKFMTQKDEIKKFLKQNGCDNFDLEFANSLPIYFLFKKINMQITFWSTVAYEALAFDIHTILVHENGYQLMSKYVDDGIFGYTENHKELIELIKNKTFNKETVSYIEASGEVVKNQFDSLLQSCIS